MACMTHDCLDCGHIAFDNARRMPVCPKCGSDHTISTWDERDDERDWQDYRELEAESDEDSE